LSKVQSISITNQNRA